MFSQRYGFEVQEKVLGGEGEEADQDPDSGYRQLRNRKGLLEHFKGSAYFRRAPCISQEIAR